MGGLDEYLCMYVVSLRVCVWVSMGECEYGWVCVDVGGSGYG